MFSVDIVAEDRNNMILEGSNEEFDYSFSVNDLQPPQARQRESSLPRRRNYANRQLDQLMRNEILVEEGKYGEEEVIQPERPRDSLASLIEKAELLSEPDQSDSSDSAQSTAQDYSIK